MITTLRFSDHATKLNKGTQYPVRVSRRKACQIESSSSDRRPLHKKNSLEHTLTKEHSNRSVCSGYNTVTSHGTADTVATDVSHESLVDGLSTSSLEERVKLLKHQVRKEAHKVKKEQEKAKVLEQMIGDLRRASPSDVVTEVSDLQEEIQRLQEIILRDGRKMDEEISVLHTETLLLQQKHAEALEILRGLKKTMYKRGTPTGYREATIARYAPDSSFFH